jgi:hypothetical protein
MPPRKYCGTFDDHKEHTIFDEPYDEHWWIRRKLRRENLTLAGKRGGMGSRRESEKSSNDTKNT